jgi:hypothetical protein
VLIQLPAQLSAACTFAAAASSSAAVGAATQRGAAAVAESDGRHSPPPVDPSEVAGGELEVVNEEEDARMLELLRAQVRSMQALLLKIAMTCVVCSCMEAHRCRFRVSSSFYRPCAFGAAASTGAVNGVEVYVDVCYAQLLLMCAVCSCLEAQHGCGRISPSYCSGVARILSCCGHTLLGFLML